MITTNSVHRTLHVVNCTMCCAHCVYVYNIAHICTYMYIVYIQAECSALKGWALQQKESQIAQVQKQQLLQLPEDATLADIEVRMRKKYKSDACAHSSTYTQ